MSSTRPLLRTLVPRPFGPRGRCCCGLWLLMSAVLGLGVGCTEPAEKGAGAQATAASEASDGEEPPLPVVTASADKLLYSYVDMRGRIQATGKIADVPEEVRSRVLVVDLGKSPEERQAHRYAFFADLTVARNDGTYPVSVVSRYDAAKGQAAPTVLPTVPTGTVILYSAVWCGYCKKAKAWLEKNNVPYVERDVEKTPGAQAELTQKLKAANVRGGGVPVLDWDGELIMGFAKDRLEGMLARQGAASAPAPAASPSAPPPSAPPAAPPPTPAGAGAGAPKGN